MRNLLVIGLCGLLLTAAGCPKPTGPGDGGTNNDANVNENDGGGGGGDAGGGGGGDDAGVPIPDGGVIITTDGGGTCIIRPCQGKVYLCGNCQDDDGDGRRDDQDPDCLGSCQNNESGFDPGIPGGGNAPCKLDCYYDRDTGSGNDNCEWNHTCDPNSPQGATCAYNENFSFGGSVTCATRRATQPPTCGSFCGPLTPNGCDCFGCCVIGATEATNATTGVFLGSTNASGAPTCTLAGANNTNLCRPCQIVQSCFKGCGRCQLCVGKDTVPPDCFQQPDGGTATDGGPINPEQCPGGQQPCGLPGQSPCSQGFFCVTGCCQPIIN